MTPREDLGHHFPGGLEPGVEVPPPAESNCPRPAARSPQVPRQALQQHALLSTICKAPSSLPGLSLRWHSAWPGWGPPACSLVTDLGAESCLAAVAFVTRDCSHPGAVWEPSGGQVAPTAFVFLTFATYQNNADFFILER